MEGITLTDAFRNTGFKPIDRRKGGADAQTTTGKDCFEDDPEGFPKAPPYPVEKGRNRATAYHIVAALSLGAGHSGDVARAVGSSRVRNGEMASGGEKSPPSADKARFGSLPESQEGILVQEQSRGGAALLGLPDAGTTNRLSPTTDNSGAKYSRDW